MKTNERYRQEKQRLIIKCRKYFREEGVLPEHLEINLPKEEIYNFLRYWAESSTTTSITLKEKNPVRRMLCRLVNIPTSKQVSISYPKLAESLVQDMIERQSLSVDEAWVSYKIKEQNA